MVLHMALTGAQLQVRGRGRRAEESGVFAPPGDPLLLILTSVPGVLHDLSTELGLEQRFLSSLLAGLSGASL